MQILWIKYCAIIAMAIFLSIPAQTAALSDQSQPEKSITLDEAQHWLTTGEYQKAYQAFLFHAESQQNALAQFTLGLFHQQGWGMSVDMKKLVFGLKKQQKVQFLPPAIFSQNVSKTDSTVQLILHKPYTGFNRLPVSVTAFRSVQWQTSL